MIAVSRPLQRREAFWAGFSIRPIASASRKGPATSPLQDAGTRQDVPDRDWPYRECVQIPILDPKCEADFGPSPPPTGPHSPGF